MDEDFTIAVSPRHSVRLAREYDAVIRKAPGRDFVIRTLVRREANGMPLMSAEIVIAGASTRAEFPLAEAYPLHFRKTYFPARLHGDPKQEFERQAEASGLIGVPPPIGYGPQVFRACLIPGQPFGALSPFDAEPMERNFPRARELALDAAAGLWLLAERAFEQLSVLHEAGLVHGDAVLRNFIVCPSPLEILPIDFEVSQRREALSDDEWALRCQGDFDPLLTQATLLQCALGPQQGRFAEQSLAHLDRLFKEPDRVRRLIERSSDVAG